MCVIETVYMYSCSISIKIYHNLSIPTKSDVPQAIEFKLHSFR